MRISLLILILFYNSVCFASSEQTLLDPQRTDTLWYTWAAYEGNSIQIFSSKWDKSNWTEPYKLSDNSTNTFTPAVTLDKDKNPWIVWAGQDGIKTSIYSRNYDGTNWSKITQVDEIDIYSDNNPSIAIDRNNIPWVTWTGSNGKNDDIYVTHWNGKNWASPTKINNEGPVPHVMSVITIDKENNPIIVWSGFEGDRYKLFFSQKIKNTWTQEKFVTESSNRFSVDLPNLLKTNDGTIELLWHEKNIHYKSLWNGIKWSEPLQIDELLIPKDFLKENPVGSGCISWSENNLIKSIRIIQPPPIQKKLITTYKSNNSHINFAWLENIFISSAVAEVEENKYIAFGDSITYGIGATDDIGYPVRLQEKLIARIGQSTVVNEGVPGDKTFDGLMRIDDVLNNDNAKYILIMEGTNDITYQYSTETIIFNLREMCNHAKDFGTTPLLATLTPRLDFLDERVRDDVNPAITTLAQENEIILVDQYTEMAKDTAAYIGDNRLHPNDAGYELIAETWFTAIDNILNPAEEESKGGCGAVPPIYKNNNSNGLFINLLLTGLLIIFILFKRLRLQNQ